MGFFSKKSSTPAPADENPYARQQPAPARNPYAQASSGPSPSTGGFLAGPPTSGNNGRSSGPPSTAGYSSNRYGASGGYGSNRYDNNDNEQSSRSSSRRTGGGGGGYGGLDNDVDDAADRDALFGGGAAAKRHEAQKERQRNRQGNGDDDDAPPPYGAAGRNDSYASQGSGGSRRGDHSAPPAYGRNDSFNRRVDDDRDADRNDLFGGAREREERAQKARGGYGGGDGDFDDDDQDGSGQAGGYGASRELSAEEQADQEADYNKLKIKEERAKAVSTVDRTLATAMGALQTSENSIRLLGAQGERFANIEANLDMAIKQNRVAADQTKELHKVNRSMFVPVMGNPFTAGSKERRRQEAMMEQHRADRDVAEETRRQAYAASRETERAIRDMNGNVKGADPDRPRDLEKRRKYLFEEDSDDDQQEEHIEDTLEALTMVSGQLNTNAKLINGIVSSQSNTIDRIGKKNDTADDGVRLNRDRLGKF